MTKLQKLVTGATELETHIQRYCVEARGGDYAVTSLHAPFDDKRCRWFPFRQAKNSRRAFDHGLSGGAQAGN